MKLAELMYGHGDTFMCHLSGRFEPGKYADAPPIQICEMTCGCWIVADGNNRVGLILRKNPEATIADLPKGLFALARYGEWDSELMEWWNPCAKSFRDVMRKRGKKKPEPSNAMYGVIEKDEEGKFVASTYRVMKGVALSGAGRTAHEAKRMLERKIKRMLKCEQVMLVLTPMTPMEDHQCSSTRDDDWISPLTPDGQLSPVSEVTNTVARPL